MSEIYFFAMNFKLYLDNLDIFGLNVFATSSKLLIWFCSLLILPFFPFEYSWNHSGIYNWLIHWFIDLIIHWCHFLVCYLYVYLLIFCVQQFILFVFFKHRKRKKNTFLVNFNFLFLFIYQIQCNFSCFFQWMIIYLSKT